MTREPGDLPSFVVTRESVGRGAPMRPKPVPPPKAQTGPDLSQ
jgi:hypothetical protein